MNKYDYLPALIGVLTISFCCCKTKQHSYPCYDANSKVALVAQPIKEESYEGYLFSKDHNSFIPLKGKKITPSEENVKSAENILSIYHEYGKDYKRQYLGSVSNSNDTIITIRLLRNAKSEDCFSSVAAIGLGEFYEQNQRVYDINLAKQTITD